ncbi:MAG: hypothetical protein JST00_40320 [Deltaproteobacteria bacterium]|nr:hypothetical protein [Deltaproteobacteria bacterium]
MTRFIEEAIARGGMGPVLASRRAGDMAAVRASQASWSKADLLVLGAVADAVRAEDVGDVVQVHERVREGEGGGVTWVDVPPGTSELDVLRAVAVARISAGAKARIGIDWSRYGLELAQVALGFGASDLTGAITRKSGLPILDDEKKKLKGQGMVDLKSIKKKEIAALVTYAGREPVFVEAQPSDSASRIASRPETTTHA